MSTTHGLYKHRLYYTWKGMRDRCERPSNKDYPYYGGRGIKLCDRWKTPVLFVQDMYPSYIEGYTIERMNNDGDYEPNNCKWVTKAENNKTKSDVLRLEYRGKTYNECELAKFTGVGRSLLKWRRNQGFTVEEMVNGNN